MEWCEDVKVQSAKDNNIIVFGYLVTFIGHKQCFLFRHLRNKFHFSEIHGSMNATGHVQIKCRTKGVSLTLHETRWVHTSNLGKMNFISYIYALFIHRFC